MISLKEAIAEKHAIAESKQFNQKMISGELTKIEYLHYLIQQYTIFKEIESKYPQLYHFHLSLARCENIKQDINELGGFILSTLDSTESYRKHLSNLDDDSILPHIYLNYLALLYGGQIIKSKIPGSGKMYDFENPQTSIANIRAIQQDNWADQANTGLDYVINIYDELQSYSR
jgi:heme oxygenase